jgi:phosphatidate cytidylyltransferase
VAAAPGAVLEDPVLGLRVLTALVLAPFALAAILLLPSAMFAPVFLLLAALALNEWLTLTGLQTRWMRLALLMLFIVAGYALLRFTAWQLPVLVASALAWIVAVAVVLAYPTSGPLLQRVPLAAAAGLLVLMGAWLALAVVHGAVAGPWLVIWLLVLVWGADAGAFFFGRMLGRRKLAPRVSPGKTWEGAFGGLVVAVAAALAVAALVPQLADLQTPPLFWLAIAVPLVVVSIFGDLFESTLKRERGVKDSGTLLPGHGGILDRIDALLSALPWYALILLSTGLLR